MFIVGGIGLVGIAAISANPDALGLGEGGAGSAVIGIVLLIGS